MSDATTTHPVLAPASRGISGVCRVCGERYTFDVPEVRCIGSAMAAGFYRRRVAECLCSCCHRPDNPAAKRLSRLRHWRRRVRRYDNPTLLLALALAGRKTVSGDMLELLDSAASSLSQLPEAERQALVAEARVLPRSICCPLHAQSELTRAMTVTGTETPEEHGGR